MNPNRSALAPGDQIGPYQLEAELGHGEMGQVFRARDTRLDRVVAIRAIRPELESREEFRRRFRREARTIATLNHPNICALHDIVEHEGGDYLVMEYVARDARHGAGASRTLHPGDSQARSGSGRGARRGS